MTNLDLLHRLPHRAPMALIEDVADVDDAAGLLCATTAPFTAHPQLSRIIIGAPNTWPRLLALEAWCQSAGLLLIAGQPRTDDQQAILISRLRDVAFHADADATSPLILRVTRTARYDIAEQFEGTIHSGSTEVATIGSLTATVRSTRTSPGETP